MTCNGSAAAPCIHAQKCHLYKSESSRLAPDSNLVAQLLINFLEGGEFTVQKVGDAEVIMKMFAR